MDQEAKKRSGPVAVNREFLLQLISEDEHGLLDLPENVLPPTELDRAIAGFAEIAEFVRVNEREPEVSSDLSETRLRWRLEAIRADADQVLALMPFDEFGLLREPEPPATLHELIKSDAFGLLDEGEDVGDSDIFELKHVPKRTLDMPEEIARREPCADFDQFEPLFRQCQRELREGVRKLVEFGKPVQHIKPGRFFVQNGVMVLVAELGDGWRDSKRRPNARIRAIWENGTESETLFQSLSANLYKDGKMVTEPDFSLKPRMELLPETEMGVLYVLRSRSEDPQIASIPNLHKIGFSRRSMKERLKGAEKSTTYLNGPVEVLAEYQVPAVAAAGVEHMLHRFLTKVRLDVAFEVRGVDVAECREWFSVPLAVIDEALHLIENDTISQFWYDPIAQEIALTK